MPIWIPMAIGAAIGAINKSKQLDKNADQRAKESAFRKAAITYSPWTKMSDPGMATPEAGGSVLGGALSGAAMGAMTAGLTGGAESAVGTGAQGAAESAASGASSVATQGAADAAAQGAAGTAADASMLQAAADPTMAGGSVFPTDSLTTGAGISRDAFNASVNGVDPSMVSSSNPIAGDAMSVGATGDVQTMTPAGSPGAMGSSMDGGAQVAASGKTPTNIAEAMGIKNPYDQNMYKYLPMMQMMQGNNL